MQRETLLEDASAIIFIDFDLLLCNLCKNKCCIFLVDIKIIVTIYMMTHCVKILED